MVVRKLVAGLVIGLLAAGYCAAQDAGKPAVKASAELSGSLFVYCAAGVREPISEIAKQFEAETKVKMELTFANTGQLLGQIETSKLGDIYIPGDIGFAAKAAEKKLTSGTPREFCYFVPAIYVRKGNPKGIKDISDLVKPGLKLALADPSAAIGQLQAKVFQKNNLDAEAVKKNTVSSPATVTDVVTAVKLGTVDAGIIWDALGNSAPDEAELVRIPREKNVTGTVAACVLASSKNPAAAAAFLDCLVSEKGRTVLKNKGFAIEKP
jgi:molybdate transport system substrate-binding protein